MNDSPERPLGEVIAAQIDQFTIQSYELHVAPPFGSLVQVEGTLGLVFAIQTSSIDPGRRAVARGGDGIRDEAIYREHPELRKLLRTEFVALVVGQELDSRVVHAYPPRPVPLHYTAYACSEATLLAYTEDYLFLRTILAARQAPADELLAAVLLAASQARLPRREYLVAAGKALARLLRDDYPRLQTVLAKCEVA